MTATWEELEEACTHLEVFLAAHGADPMPREVRRLAFDAVKRLGAPVISEWDAEADDLNALLLACEEVFWASGVSFGSMLIDDGTAALSWTRGLEGPGHLRWNGLPLRKRTRVVRVIVSRHIEALFRRCTGR